MPIMQKLVSKSERRTTAVVLCTTRRNEAPRVSVMRTALVCECVDSREPSEEFVSNHESVRGLFKISTSRNDLLFIRYYSRESYTHQLY